MSLLFTGAFLLCVYILVYLRIKRNLIEKTIRWKQVSGLLIRRAIFDESDDIVQAPVLFSHQIKSLLPDYRFREVLTHELVSSRKTMTGQAALNIQKIFRQLKLDQDAVKKLDSPSWYIRATGIQQIGIMQLQEHVDRINAETNHKNELVRMEAQIAMLKFQGFEGLRFLDEVSYPITVWQQINMLAQLSKVPPEKFTGITKWLKSENDSVVIFALKLIKNYHRFECYHEVISCLQHLNTEVRNQAIFTLGEIDRGEAGVLFANSFDQETQDNQLAILAVLKDVAHETEIPFLLSVLASENNELIVAATAALYGLGPEGKAQLELHSLSKEYPLREIIAQFNMQL